MGAFGICSQPDFKRTLELPRVLVCCLELGGVHMEWRVTRKYRRGVNNHLHPTKRPISQLEASWGGSRAVIVWLFTSKTRSNNKAPIIAGGGFLTWWPGTESNFLAYDRPGHPTAWSDPHWNVRCVSVKSPNEPQRQNLTKPLLKHNNSSKAFSYYFRA